MLTYELKKQPGLPLYESLYRCIRSDILNRNLLPGAKLPSKRALSANLEVSKVTVEAAYNQLLAEGFISSREKVGYFVEAIEQIPQTVVLEEPPQQNQDACIDLTANGPAHFPFSVWSKLQREVMLDLVKNCCCPWTIKVFGNCGKPLPLILPNSGACRYPHATFSSAPVQTFFIIC